MSQAELAALLGITDRQVRKLHDATFEGGLPRGQDGRYVAARCLAWYVRWKQQEALGRAAPAKPAGRDEADARRAAAEAELAEIKVRQLRGELVQVSVHEAELRRVLGAVAVRVRAIPGEWAPRLIGKADVQEATAALREIERALLAQLQGAADVVEEDQEDG